jgi:hypothetical protein
MEDGDLLTGLAERVQARPWAAQSPHEDADLEGYPNAKLEELAQKARVRVSSNERGLEAELVKKRIALKTMCDSNPDNIGRIAELVDSIRACLLLGWRRRDAEGGRPTELAAAPAGAPHLREQQQHQQQQQQPSPWQVGVRGTAAMSALQQHAASARSNAAQATAPCCCPPPPRLADPQFPFRRRRRHRPAPPGWVRTRPKATGCCPNSSTRGAANSSRPLWVSA